MAISSRINSSLKRKRRMGKLRQTIYYSIFVLFFISLVILSFTSNKLIINNVAVSGNSAVPKENILSVVEEHLNDKYLWFIRTDNLFLLRNSEIKQQILDEYKKIKSVKIGFKGLASIGVVVTERTPESIWCKGSPNNQGQCYFMDKEGFVFSEAPGFGGNPFPKYFGYLSAENPIGTTYFDAKKYVNMRNFYNSLLNENFYPQYFYSLSEHEYEVGLYGGGKLKLSDNQSFEKSLLNLKALVTNGYINNGEGFVKKINYIDLRYGNKVPFDLND
jgi:hypothetical protein